MTDEGAYARAATMWLAATGLVLYVTERHFGSTAADLAAWLPFAMFLRCAWKWWKAKQR